MRLLGLAPRLARLSVFLIVVGIGLHIALGKVVRAQVDDALIELGSGLLQMAGPGPEGAARVLELNGERFHFETGTRAEPVGQVLDEAEDGCSAGAETGPNGRFLRGTDGPRGFVACFTRLTRAESSAEGETAASSGYRYVYAQAGAERTQVVRFWSERPLDLARLFPAAGDAPGSDAPGVPRPPEARRILSARELGEPQQLTLYLRGSETRDLDAWYRERLTGLGWRPLDARRPVARAGDRALVVDRSGQLAALVFSDAEGGERSVAILTSL